MHIVRHCFHFKNGVPVIGANAFNRLLNYFLDLTPYYTMSVFWTETYMVVDVVDTIIGFSFHELIIPARPSYVNTFFQ